MSAKLTNSNERLIFSLYEHAYEHALLPSSQPTLFMNLLNTLDIKMTTNKKYIIPIEDWPSTVPYPDGLPLYWESQDSNDTRTSSSRPAHNLEWYRLVGIDMSAPEVINGLRSRNDAYDAIFPYVVYLHTAADPITGERDWNCIAVAERIGMKPNDHSDVMEWLREFCVRVFAYRSESGKRSWEYEDPPEGYNNV